jgi:transposase
MEILHACCCGIDVHAKTIVACLIKNGSKTTRTFSTMTDDLLQFLDWLLQEGCTHVAMESTGVYWRPVYNILEGQMDVILVNARHIKQVPGRKTDVRDCEWIADCLRHGLLKASFIPPLEIRELRELTRYRTTLTQELTRVANRIQKVIESGNIKLGQVASDVMGLSGRAMLTALAHGETDTERMSEMAQRQLKKKKAELGRSLQGRLTNAQRWVLSDLLQRYTETEEAIKRVTERIDEEIKSSTDPFVREAIDFADEIPGIGKQSAENILAEIGVRMSVFPSARHLSSWAGMSPGNNESAGKRKSTNTTKGNPYLRRALVEAAWAASHTKSSYLSAQYHRLARRIGKKRALMAVGHSILIILYQMLSKREHYQDLGIQYLDQRNKAAIHNHLVRRLQSLGYRVTTEEVPVAA